MLISMRLVAIVAIVSSLMSTSTSAQSSGGTVLPTFKELNRLGLERGWYAQAVLNPTRDKVRNISIDEDLVYVQASSGVTTALDAETGQQLWANQLGRLDQPSFPAVSNEDLALIVVGSTMYGLEKRTGRTVWTLVLPGQPSTGPAVDNRQVYFGTLDGSVYAYSLRKIRQLYQERRLPQWSNEAQVWKYKSGKEVTSPPITTGRVVNFASRDGSLYSLNAIDRSLVYQLETDKAIVAPLTRLENTMFMASEDSTFYAVDLFNGRVKWEFATGLPVRKAPWAIDKDLYILPDRGGMFCLEPATGEQRWWHPDLASFIAVVGGSVATTDTNGNLVMVSRKKGEIIGSLPIRGFSVRAGNDRTDRIYIATESGLVVSLRQLGHAFPVYHRFPDRLPLLPEIEPEEGATGAATPNSERTEDE